MFSYDYMRRRIEVVRCIFLKRFIVNVKVAKVDWFRCFIVLMVFKSIVFSNVVFLYGWYGKEFLVKF